MKGYHTRIDIVFDDYTIQSIKSGTRQQRNTKKRKITRIIDSCKIRLPPVWQSFISLDENKKNSYMDKPYDTVTFGDLAELFCCNIFSQ